MKKHDLTRSIASVKKTTMPRRKFIQMLAASSASLSFPMGSLFAAQQQDNHKPAKVIWLVLRGALDALHTIVPYQDEHYKKLRPSLANSFKKPLLPLERGFALHPNLEFLYNCYQEKALIPIVAVSSGFTSRSHFDGQDFLETGNGGIEHDNGWLARAIKVRNKRALAIARTTPISLRNQARVNTWYPSRINSADGDTYAALSELYQYDNSLTAHLDKGLAIRGLVGANNLQQKRRGKFVDLAKACAQLITADPSIDCAMLELGGWDTHKNQGQRLTQKFTELNNGLAQLKTGLANEWQNTVVIIATEFGRTVKENGTAGTDHGTASAMFLAGGAVQGGKVLGQWPGLEQQALFQQRDLMPTSNTYGWIGNVLKQHWQFTESELKQVFPHMNSYNQVVIGNSTV